MTVYVDGGWLSYHIHTEPEHIFEPWKLIEQMCDKGYIICIDSDQSIRKDKYDWYKTNRNNLFTQEAIELRVEIKAWRREAVKKYGDCIRAIPGLEADDLMAMYASPNDTILSPDTDMLQLVGVKLIDINPEDLATKRLAKMGKQGITQGERFMAYQLCVGDGTDTIARLLFTKDRTTIPSIMTQDHPLKTVLEMVNIDKARAHLDCLLTPTPLYSGVDPILYCERYYGFRIFE